jgi:hypothetical protein
MNQLLIFFCALLAASTGRTQTAWPQTLTAPDGGVIKLYQPQPDSIRDNSLTWRSAFSLLETGHGEPSFGSFQAVATLETDRDERIVTILSTKVTDLRDGNQWKPLDGRAVPTIRGLERQRQNDNRGQMRLQNFQQLRGGAAGIPRAGGAPARPRGH